MNPWPGLESMEIIVHNELQTPYHVVLSSDILYPLKPIREGRIYLIDTGQRCCCATFADALNSVWQFRFHYVYC